LAPAGGLPGLLLAALGGASLRGLTHVVLLHHLELAVHRSLRAVFGFTLVGDPTGPDLALPGAKSATIRPTSEDEAAMRWCSAARLLTRRSASVSFSGEVKERYSDGPCSGDKPVNPLPNGNIMNTTTADHRRAEGSGNISLSAPTRPIVAELAGRGA
jgi:hypothetical protein